MPENLIAFITKLSQPFPRFDDRMKTWFRTNLWIISLVMAIIAGLDALYLLGNFLNTLRAMAMYDSAVAMYYGGGSSIVGFLRLHLIVSMLVAVGTTVLLGVATAGLKQQTQTGWFLLAITLLILTGFGIIGVLLDVILAPALMVTPFLTVLGGLAMLYVTGQVSDQFTKK